MWNNVCKFHLVEFVPFTCVPNEFPSCEHWVKKSKKKDKKVTKIRVSKIRVSEIRVSKIRVSEIRVREIRVSEIRISSNHRELHGAIFVQTRFCLCMPDTRRTNSILIEPLKPIPHHCWKSLRKLTLPDSSAFPQLGLLASKWDPCSFSCWRR